MMADFENANETPTSASLPPGKNRDAPVVPLPVKHQKEVKTEGAGLLTLPRELRDKIYDYLLRIDRFDPLKYEKKDLSKLDLSILRVNQTLHREASETLYEENPLVCISIERSLLQALRNLRVITKEGFPGNKPVPVASYGQAAAVAVAKMSVRRPIQVGLDDLLVVSLFAMPQVCRLLTALNKASELYFQVNLHSPKNGKIKKVCQKYLLDCFQEARGFKLVTIVDTHGNDSHAELATLMMSPFKSFWEVFDPASAYYDRALQKQKLGRLSEARCDYQDGQDLIHWFFESMRYLFLSHHNEDDENMGTSILQLWTKIGFSCSFLCIKLGDLDWALHLIEWMLDVQPDGKDESHTEAWYLYGLRDLAIGADNGAAYCFLQALWKQPGHTGADQTVDEMEERLRCCTGLAERITLHNIQHILQPFRHQTDGSVVMSEEEYMPFIQQWYVGRKEHNSIGFRHDRDGSKPKFWSAFEKLPREIRDLIYEYCLLCGGEIIPFPYDYEKIEAKRRPQDAFFGSPYIQSASYFKREKSQAENKPCVALLGVNSTVRDEAALILFGNNVWRLSSRPHAQDGRFRLWETYAKYFRYVITEFDCCDVDETQLLDISMEEMDRVEEDVGHFDQAGIANIHHKQLSLLRDGFIAKRDILHQMNLKSLSLDFSNTHCPIGCCRREALQSCLVALGSTGPWCRLERERGGDFQTNLKTDLKVLGLNTDWEKKLFWDTWGLKMD